MAITPSINPLVKLIKIQRGEVDPIEETPSGSLACCIQELLYNYTKDPQYHQLTLLDKNPIVLILVSNRDKQTRKQLFPVPFFRGSKTAGIFGLNMNLLISSNEPVNLFLTELKTKLLTYYLEYINNSSFEGRSKLITSIKPIILTIWELTRDKKIFIQNPFNFYKLDSILFSSTIKEPSLINKLKTFKPSLESQKAFKKEESKKKKLKSKFIL